VNDKISSKTIRLVDENGDMVGIVNLDEGLQRALKAGLDLVEVSSNADPPVCKILDFWKFKYQQRKKKSESRKKQKITTVKEIKVRPSIEENDYQVKLRRMCKFLEEKDKVKVTLRFRGREMAHKELGLKVLRRIQEDLKELSKVEYEPKLEGRQIIMILAPA
jgi:translation initiation factor IF-3